MSNEYKLINGIKIAEKIKDEIVKEIIKLPSRPNLAIILIGDNKESCLYVNIKNKKICIIANSDIFGKNFAKFLNCLGAQAETTKIGDKNLTDKTKNADILISAVGRKHFIKKEMIKEGAALIDVGIVKEDKKIYGDIDAEDVKEKAGFLTPVPGGVGPLTIAMLFQNTLELYKIHKNINHHLLL